MADRYNERRRWRRQEEGEDFYNEPRSYANRYNRGYSMGTSSSEPYGPDYERGWDYGERFDPGAYNRYSGRRGSDYDEQVYKRGYAYRFGRGSRQDTNLGDYGRRRDYPRGFRYDWEGEEYAPNFNYREYYYPQGQFTGIGPRSYTRSDDRIREDIYERLTRHGQVDARDIQVEVNNGEVTLQGSVPNRRMKYFTEDLVESVYGVRDLQNHLRVTRTHRQSRRDLSRLRDGMPVIGNDGEQIGWVKEVRQDDFLVDRPMALDVYVPFSAVWETNSDVTLNIAADEVDRQRWPAPALS